MLIVEVSYENIISHLKVRLSTFDLEAVQIVIDEMVKNYLYERRMFVVSQNIFIDTENMLRKSLLNAEVRYRLHSCSVLAPKIGATCASSGEGCWCTTNAGTRSILRAGKTCVSVSFARSYSRSFTQRRWI